MAISKNKKLLYQLRKHVLERDNYTCRKCGLASIPKPHREEYLTKLGSKAHPANVEGVGLDIYDTVSFIKQVARNSLAKSDKRSNVV
ncbi:MAG TPA: hypothetical protein VKA95_00025 [Nitrososphaeraceae archaeon]|nr:hypothetical protein [Nitrososphaeraceae archaeon]